MTVGTLCGGLACFSVYGVTLWTLLRGPKGRAALMICAALLAVKAVCVDGSTAYMNISELFSSPDPVWKDTGGSLLGAASLANLAWCLAFPLAVRMALSLAEVRAKLDGLNKGENARVDAP